ncbi:S-adenosyl-L-methionine-dependent methyltransferase [Aspergillus heteromorphus CBS 117.55]|uniref:catechol O-methyltransferase n=1 Tax=Aspergillus heteromorphus CBS 117.55 TaxID=1448321 RepID=A0A317VFI5_9EURO|nr:S-adenosyl-L-methionine-dependent methyltransferase [Aspergillus heteromorphus CBS 117.55]PWY71718.1 S-adenosyl-L-methionine-dependent methyltransferase [Aspergillus heteromorphus CBS 117.55]
MSFYKPEEEVYCNDGRESALLSQIHSHPTHSTMQNNPSQILAAIDEFGREKNFLMNVGESKGAIVTKEIQDRNPTIMVELGGYIGYSAILFGSTLKQMQTQRQTQPPTNNQQKKTYISLELNPNFAHVARTLVQLAGLDDIVEIMVGPCRQSLRRLKERYPDGGIDMFFLDHAKVAYANDLKLAEELGLVRPGTVVLADNVVSPGNPEFLEYVWLGVERKVENVRKRVGDEGEWDGEGDDSVGNPYLVYDTRTVRGLEVTGVEDAVEVSYCVELVRS